MRAQVIAVAVMLAGATLAARAAGADELYYKWRDPRGRLHYSNVPSVPSPEATTVLDFSGTRAASVSESTPRRARRSSAGAYLQRYQLRQAYRRAERELRATEAFFTSLRQRERERLERYSVHQILADWEVADRASELRQLQAELHTELEQIRAAERELNKGSRQGISRLATVGASD